MKHHVSLPSVLQTPLPLLGLTFFFLPHQPSERMSDIKTRVVGAANTLEHRIYFGKLWIITNLVGDQSVFFCFILH
jgi:hypothetical protein